MNLRRIALSVAFVLLVGEGILTAQTQSAKPNFILLVVPEADTVETNSSVYRFNACTLPNAALSVNGRAFHVYPSGAVAGLLEVAIGDNSYVITSVEPSGATITKTFVIRREKPPESIPPDSIVIESAMMRPAEDHWYRAGEMVECQIKGTPGATVTFMNSIAMRELSPQEAHGLQGVYRGVYMVQPSDTLRNVPIEFRLEKNGKVATRSSTAKISFMGQELPRVAVARMERTALYYGTGDDRLGGAVMSYVKAGVRMVVTGKIGHQLRVALAEGHEAWVDQHAVELQPTPSFLPAAETGNWNVYGDQKLDYVTVSMNDKLPYVSYQEVEPTRIVIDLFGAEANSNWIIQNGTAKEIKNVYYMPAGTGIVRIVIELKHRQSWGYDIGYDYSGLVIKIRRQPERLKIKALTFALDAGHGGTNLGALGSTGAKEKDVNLATVLQLKELLEDKGAKVILTRDIDTNLTMVDRLKKSVNSGADILIAVHSNSIGLTTNPELTKGVSTYYKHIFFRPLSSSILNEVMKTGLTSAGNVGSFNFTLNAPTDLPNALVELAYMSNPEDEMKLLDPEFRKKIVQRIMDGIDDFLDYCDE